MTTTLTEWECTVPAGSELVLCGAGNLCRQLISQYNYELGSNQIIGIVDNAPEKWGQKINGGRLPELAYTIQSPMHEFNRYGISPIYVILIHLGADDMRKQLEGYGVPPERIIHWWTLWQHFDTLKMPEWADVPPHPEDWLDVWSDEASKKVIQDAYAFFKTYSDRTAAYVPREAYSLPDNIYFDETIYRPLVDERFLDCGAFDGDTMMEYRKRYDMYQADILCVEANPDNFKLLSARQQKLVPEGTREWCALVADPEIESVQFAGSGVSSKIAEEGVTVPATTIDKLCRFWLTSLVKIDCEGAELDILRGAVATIKRDRPVIAVCLYHRPSDMWTIPAFLATVCEGYVFRARCYDQVGFELVMYAVPVERAKC